MAVKTSIDVKIIADETQQRGLGGPAIKDHRFALLLDILTGTASSQIDRVWSDSLTATGASTTIDLIGSLTSKLDASTVSFTGGVCLIAVRNNATTSSYILTVGAGSNPFAGWSGAGSHTRLIHPGGWEIWGSLIDDVAPVAGTGDIITFNPGANTINFDVLLLGRSA